MTVRLLVLLAVVVLGCRAAPEHGKVVVIGLDGLDPGVVDTMMSEGSMPNFAALRREGAYGPLRSARPILSPIIWTTIATGRPPADHGIGHFVAVNERTGEHLPVTSRMRRVKALWNMVSDAGRTVDVVGWWATWPAESVHGAIVSDHTCYHFLFPDGAGTGKAQAALVHPPELEAEIAPMIERPGDLGPGDLAPFVDVDEAALARPFAFDDPLSHFRWALATGETYRQIGLHLLARDRPDLLMVYIEGTDSTSHLFGHLFRAEGLAGELAEQQRQVGGAVEEMYHWADRLVGEYMNAIDDDTTLVVLSDHGFALGTLPDDPSQTRDMRRVSEKFHRIDGILYLWGRDVRARARIDGATLVDVAPTILTLLGLPAANDMPGRVLDEALVTADAPARVATYEAATARASGGADDAAVDPAILERLKALGYLDTSSPQGDGNMAAMHFQAGRYAESAALYEKLVAAKPDDAGLRTSLAGALGALGRIDDAAAQLDVALRLDAVNVEAHHNRGVIHERRGDKDAAIAEYRTALRYDGSYEPARTALERLGGASVARPERTPDERRAVALADEASQAAKRGDYPAAMRTLDEAQRLAPQLALVHQYRANVAYLMGDTPAAVAALRRALEIEPDNALFKRNLAQLERPSGGMPPGQANSSP
jgi:predicted AlkP superfamily phosphohydrolase/phosphomutase/Tfp pilus assembly protein PilF